MKMKMKHPVAVIGFTYLAVLCVAAQMGTGLCVVLALLFAAGAILLLFGFGHFSKRALLLTIFLAAAAGWSIYALVWHFSYWPSASLAGKTAQVSGVVLDTPVQSGSTASYFVRTSAVKIDNTTAPQTLTLRVQTTQKDIAPYSRVSFKTTLELPSATANGFNSQQYYRAKGVTLFARPQGKVSISAPKGVHPYLWAIALRTHLAENLRTRVGGQWGELASGILIGDVDGLSQTVKTDFTTAGISHILAVSGTQISLLMQVLLLLFGRLRCPKRLSAVLTAGVLLLFMAITGFSASVNRAGLMAFLFLAAQFFSREADALDCLGFSVLVLCVLNPFAASDVGLLLSFSATLGLILLATPLMHRIEKGLHHLPPLPARILRIPGAALGETVAATVLTLPVILLTFRQFSVVTFFSNILEVPVSLLATLLAAVTALLPGGVFFVWLVRPFALLLRICCAFMMTYAHFLASLPYASLSTDYAFVYLVLLLGIGFAFLYWRMRGHGADLRILSVCVAFGLAVGVVSYNAAAHDVLMLDALPVTAGNCTVIRKSGHAIVWNLSGSSSVYTLTTWLKRQNISRIDALFLPVYAKKSAEWVQDLEEQIPVQKVLLPASASAEETAHAQPVSAVTSVDWMGTTFHLYPSADTKTFLTTLRYKTAQAVLTDTEAKTPEEYAVSSHELTAGELFYSGDLSEDFVHSISPRNAITPAEKTDGKTGGMLGAVGCSVRTVDEQVISARTRGGVFQEVTES